MSTATGVERKLREDIKTAWLEELRSGRYKQAQGTLRGRVLVYGEPTDEVGYCCLGVLAEVLDKQFPEVLAEAGCRVKVNAGILTEDDLAIFWNEPRVERGTTSTIPLSLALAVGLNGAEGLIPEHLQPEGMPYLSTMNDRGKTFDEIADVIEQM